MPRLETRLRAIHGPHFSVHRTLLGLWVAIGALVASAPGVQAEEGQQRYTSRTTPHVTCVTRHAQNQDHATAARRIGDQRAFKAFRLQFLNVFDVQLPGQVFDGDRDREPGRGLQDERDEALG